MATAAAPNSRTPNSRPIKSTRQVAPDKSHPTSHTRQVNPTSRQPDRATQIATAESRARLIASLLSDTALARRELMGLTGLRDRESFYNLYLLPAPDLGLIEYTIPGKPNSRLQKYRLTAKGRAALARSRRRPS